MAHLDKRSLALAGAVAVLALLAGCGSATSAASGEFTPKTPGVLTVATEQVPAPGFWEGTAAKPTGGFEYGLAQYFADRFGLDSIRVIEVPFPKLVAGDLGGADIALSRITPTSEREENLDFSVPYLDAAPTVLVRAGTDVPDLAAAQELTWGVSRSSALEGYIRDAIQPDDPQIVLGDTQRDVLDALTSGRVDAVMFDLPVAVALADRSDGKLVAAAKLPRSEGLSVALRDGSDNVAAVDSAINAATNDGTIDDLLDQWVGSDASDASANIPIIQTTLDQ